MVKGTGQMYITGPDVVKAVTGAEVTHEELGGADSHATRSGVAHFVYESEDECLAEVRRLLGFLPANNVADPPLLPLGDPVDRFDPDLRYWFPMNPTGLRYAGHYLPHRGHWRRGGVGGSPD